MPSKKKPAAAGMTALPSIPKELIEQLTGGATPMTVCVRLTHLAPDLNGWCARQRMVYAAIDSR
mgnify:CR=1 FL=1